MEDAAPRAKNTERTRDIPVILGAGVSERHGSEANRVRPRPDAGRVGEADVVGSAVGEVGVDDRFHFVEDVGDVDLSAPDVAALELEFVAREEIRDRLVRGEVDLPFAGRIGLAVDI